MPALGEISHLCLNISQEDAILELLKEFSPQSLRLQSNPSTSKTLNSSPKNDKSTSSSSSDSDEKNDEDSGSDHDGVNDEIAPSEIDANTDKKELPSNFLSALATPSLSRINSAERKLIVRQMIRDDRRRHVDSIPLKRDRKIAKKLFRQVGAVAECLDVMAITEKSTRVRLSVHCISTGQSEMMIVDRVNGMQILCDQIWQKFSMKCTDYELQLVVSPTSGGPASSTVSHPVLLTNDIIANLLDGQMILVSPRVERTGSEAASLEPELSIQVLPPHLSASRVNTSNDTPRRASLHSHEIIPLSSNSYRSDKMRERLILLRETSAEYREITARRSSLPIHAQRDRVLAEITACPTVVISGETGCGYNTTFHFIFVLLVVLLMLLLLFCIIKNPLFFPLMIIFCTSKE